MIPPERLLVYNWSDGWAPLAHFLGTAIPEEEFPHDDPVRSHFEKCQAKRRRFDDMEGLKRWFRCWVQFLKQRTKFCGEKMVKLLARESKIMFNR